VSAYDDTDPGSGYLTAFGTHRDRPRGTAHIEYAAHMALCSAHNWAWRAATEHLWFTLLEPTRTAARCDARQ
jgi:hypothetical protein